VVLAPVMVRAITWPGGRLAPCLSPPAAALGPPPRFHDFVETYAADEGAEERKALYRLRSAFVHGGALHNPDIARPWGGMEPHVLRHHELHDIALKVSWTAIRTWFLSQPATEPPAPEEPASE
jgi:hypothetical protein